MSLPHSRIMFLLSLLVTSAIHLYPEPPRNPQAPIVGNPLAASTARPTPEPTSPPPQHLRDPHFGVSFDLPVGWNLSRRDGDLSTFALDARSVLPSTQMRAVANIAFNPFPLSTFSGALFYFSGSPRSTPLQCSNQATAAAPRKVAVAEIDSVPFNHGYDEHGAVCTEARDEVYTALHNGFCYRFDLVINTFCGGEVSGSRDMTPGELDSIRHRLESILSTVRISKPQDVLHPRADRAMTK